ncbi:hypothetical protein [Ursidibacter arcticus]
MAERIVSTQDKNNIDIMARFSVLKVYYFSTAITKLTIQQTF